MLYYLNHVGYKAVIFLCPYLYYFTYYLNHVGYKVLTITNPSCSKNSII